jgi:hypothetical protein
MSDLNILPQSESLDPVEGRMKERITEVGIGLEALAYIANLFGNIVTGETVPAEPEASPEATPEAESTLQSSETHIAEADLLEEERQKISAEKRAIDARRIAAMLYEDMSNERVSQ